MSRSEKFRNPEKTIHNKVFINLSNHPSSKWVGKQRLDATKNNAELVDIQFPNIDPAATDNDIDMLVNEYVNKILAFVGDDKKTRLEDIIVHVMGEMTFTYKLVDRLLNYYGIQCVASTTKRIVIENEEDVTKTSIFEFVQFRKY